MQYTQAGHLKYSKASAVHLMANVVHLSGAPDVLYMTVSTVHLMANAIHSSEAPDVHDSICSTLIIWTITDQAPAPLPQQKLQP